jgi:C4-dicarboxylate-specific signal transduction histidine kinase
MDKNHLLHEMELAFFGTITASVSHELNNVLSIINEYAGLLDDLVSADTKGRPLENERIKKIALNIAEQINREQKIIKLLNRFAHRVDTPLVQFDLIDLVHDIIRLSRRFASLNKVSLEFTLPQESISITNNPFGVQHALFSCLNLALDFAYTNDSINTILDKEESQVVLNITSRPIDKNKETEKKLEYISLIISNVGGKMNIKLLNDYSQIIKLFIPLSIPDRVRDI